LRTCHFLEAAKFAEAKGDSSGISQLLLQAFLSPWVSLPL